MLLPFAFTASAAEYKGTFTVKTVFYDKDGNTADTLEMNPGDSVRADVYFTSDFIAGAITLGLRYDSAVFELDTVRHIEEDEEYPLLDCGEGFSGIFTHGYGGPLPADFDSAKDSVLWVMTEGYKASKYTDFKAFSVWFKVKESAAPGAEGSFGIIPGSVRTEENMRYPTGVDYVTDDSVEGTVAPLPSGSYLSAIDFELTVTSASGKVKVASPKDDSEEEFNKFKEETKTASDALAQSGDGEEGRKLISDAKGRIDALAYDSSKTLDENKSGVTAIYNKLRSDLEALRSKKYTVTYYADGKAVMSKEVRAGEAVPKPADPAKEGYTFEGWTPAVPGKMPAENLEFNAVFKEIPAPSYRLPSFREKSADYKTYVTVSIKPGKIPDGAKVFIDNVEAKKDNSVYTADIGQVKDTRTVKVEVIKDGKTLDSSTLTVNVKTGFFDKLISVIVNFLFNWFKWKRVTVAF